MASNEKVINTKNLRLVETLDFDIKIILIRGRMQPVEPKQGQGQKLQSYVISDRPNGCQKICHETLGETV